MKHFLLIVAALLFGMAGKSQDIVLHIDQSGQAYKNAKTGHFEDAEVKDARALIILKKDRLVVSDSTKQLYMLTRKDVEKKSKKPLVTKVWTGTDEDNKPVVLKMTVNMESKSAVVEVAYSQLKNYYFGTCNSLGLARD